jgi:pimeloyl-ACP methyl ester carboxylesterase
VIKIQALPIPSSNSLFKTGPSPCSHSLHPRVSHSQYHLKRTVHDNIPGLCHTNEKLWTKEGKESFELLSFLILPNFVAHLNLFRFSNFFTPLLLSSILPLLHSHLIMPPKPTLVFVPGSWHGAITWSKIPSLLETQQYKCVAVDLPSNASNPSATFLDDITAVRKLIMAETAQGHDVNVVEHSYGGQVGNSAVKGLTRSKDDGSSSTGQTGHVIGIAMIATGFTITGVGFLEGLGQLPPSVTISWLFVSQPKLRLDSVYALFQYSAFRLLQTLLYQDISSPLPPIHTQKRNN